MRPTREQLQTTRDTLRTLQDAEDKSKAMDCRACERYNLLEAAGHIVQDYIEAAAEIADPPRADLFGGSFADMICPLTGPSRFNYDKAKAELAKAKAQTGPAQWCEDEKTISIVLYPSYEPKPPKEAPTNLGADGRKTDDAIGQPY